jgi:hypothetical protein
MKNRAAFYAAAVLSAAAWLLNAYAAPTSIVPEAQTQVGRAVQAATAGLGLGQLARRPSASAPAPRPETVSFHVDPALVQPAPEPPKQAGPTACMSAVADTELSLEAPSVIQAPGRPIEAVPVGGVCVPGL